MHQVSFLGLLALAAGAVEATVPSDNVPLIGPSFLANFDPTDSEHIRNATEAFPTAIEALFEKEVLNKTDLVFAVDVFSAATNKSLYTYYHVGEEGKTALTSGEFNDETISRTGSVSKLFTVYALLLKAGIEVFAHPVTRYLPELLGNSSGDPLDHVRWEDITVGALASHQAGTGGPASFFLEADDATALTTQDFLKYMRDVKRPVVSPFRNAVYSDAGYGILTEVLARISGMSYGDALRDALYKPLGLNGTSVVAPNGTDINAINRKPLDNMSAFGEDFPVVAGSGGVYSNMADLRAFGLSILNSELLSAATTSQWMKPMGGTGSLIELVGAPWEITRLAIPVAPGSNRTRISDLYSKAGGNDNYTCIIALSPDHGIGFSILVAGDTATPARWPIRDAIGELVIPAAEAAAAENAEKNLAGVFAAGEGNNITLSFDEDHPGLGIESWYVEGAETMTPEVTVRVYPAGLYSNSRSLSALYNTNGTFQASHRAVVTPPVPRAASEGGTGGLFDNQFSWMQIAFQDGTDEFIFTMDEGKLTVVENVARQLSFERVE